MADLQTMIEGMEGDRREGALAVLDYLTRPMTVREIEAALRVKGKVPRSRAVKLAGSIKGLHIVAMIGPGND